MLRISAIHQHNSTHEVGAMALLDITAAALVVGDVVHRGPGCEWRIRSIDHLPKAVMVSADVQRWSTVRDAGSSESIAHVFRHTAVLAVDRA